MLVALGELVLHATAKSMLLLAYLWGRTGGRDALKALSRPLPPFGGFLKIGADFLVFGLTQALFVVVYRLAQGAQDAWNKNLADVWAQGLWTKIWMSAAVVTAAGLIIIKLVDILITLFSLKTWADDALSDAPPVRRRLLFVTGLEFVLWQLVGGLGKVALFFARFLLGAGWARWIMKHFIDTLSQPPDEFFAKFFEKAASGSPKEKAGYFLQYVVRFSVVRGLAVAFFALALW